MIASAVSWITHGLHDLPSAFVYLAVFGLVFGEAALFVGFVLPGETSVLVAGAVASEGHVNIVWLVVLVVVAAIVGDTVGYFVGERYGERLLQLPILRRRRAELDRALIALERRGATYVFLGRFTAFLRAVMPGLAGMSAMRYRRFLVANAAGGLAWGVTYALLGYYAGKTLNNVEHTASWVGIGVLCAIIAFVIVHWLWRRRSRRNTGVDEI
jgi:membrane protein DedA with SNARE-associated domain